MFQIVGDTLRRASTSHTIGNAIICEAVRTITTIYPNQILLRSGASLAGTSSGQREGCQPLRWPGLRYRAANDDICVCTVPVGSVDALWHHENPLMQ